MIDCMNQCKFQYVCFGNHECDIPHSELINRIKESNFKWINTNMTDINLGDIKLPEYEEITVKGGGQTRKVGLIGLLTEDPGLYRPGVFGGATITPVKTEAEKMQQKLVVEGGMDLVLPMTHQVIGLDREFMEYFKGKGVDNENAFPFIVGAHDHEPYEVELAGSKVLKTGSDAKNVGIVDIVWPDPNSKKVEVSMRLEPIENFGPNPMVQVRACSIT
jgi:2',3'-cyclic-nucleotide 2'-phosphodiesterase (5'-nucleotidase family)